MRERYLIGRLTQNWTTWSGIHFQSIPTPSSLFALKTRVSWTFSKSIMITNRTRTYPSRYPCIYRYQRVPPEMRHHRGLAICAGWGFCSKKLSRLHERLFRPSSPPPPRASCRRTSTLFYWRRKGPIGDRRFSGIAAHDRQPLYVSNKLFAASSMCRTESSYKTYSAKTIADVEDHVPRRALCRRRSTHKINKAIPFLTITRIFNLL